MILNAIAHIFYAWKQPSLKINEFYRRLLASIFNFQRHRLDGIYLPSNKTPSLSVYNTLNLPLWKFVSLKTAWWMKSNFILLSTFIYIILSVFFTEQLNCEGVKKPGIGSNTHIYWCCNLTHSRRHTPMYMYACIQISMCVWVCVSFHHRMTTSAAFFTPSQCSCSMRKTEKIIYIILKSTGVGLFN